VATTTTSNPASQADKIQKHFSKKLLAYAQHNLQLAQFGQEGELPKNVGSNTVRYFRRRDAKTDDVVELSEGTPINTFTEVTYDHVDIALKQYGEAAKITDIVTMTDLFNMLQQSIEAMGDDCELHHDTVVRNAIVASMLNSDSLNERFAGVTPSGNSSADFGDLELTSASNAKFTRAAALAAVTQLKHRKNRAPKINGSYVCVLPAELCHDLVQDDDWLEAAKYSNVKALYNNELGYLDGVRYVEATNPFVEGSTYGTFDDTGAIYTAMFLGRDAFGCPKLSGTTSPKAPKIIVNDQPDKSDPLNQFITAGWKSYWNAEVLHKKFLVLLRAKSTFA